MRTGIDIVEIDRIKTDDIFLSKIASAQEIAYIRTYKTEQNQKESTAGLWAVKEAVFKALGLGKNSTITFKNVELCHEESGRPFVRLNGIAIETFQKLGLSQVEVSISHTKTNAVAIVVMK